MARRVVAAEMRVHAGRAVMIGVVIVEMRMHERRAQRPDLQSHAQTHRRDGPTHRGILSGLTTGSQG